MERLEMNLKTGELSVILLTEEEIVELQSRPQPEPTPELTPAEKLAASGLTVEELKGLLGLQ